jgi:hypothetical protein
MKARKPQPRHCETCGKTLFRQNKTGFCLPCLQTRPEFKARRIAGMKRVFANPEHLEKMRKVIARNHAKARIEKPEFEAWLVNHGKELAKLLQTPEIKAKTFSEETRAKAAKAQSEAKLGWCPPEFRAEYRMLVRKKRMHSKDARPIIEAKAAEKAREDRAVKHPCWQSVIDHMRRTTAVILLGNGNYRVGTAELTPGQLLERAELRGYELPRWAA